VSVDIYRPTAQDRLSLAELDLYHRITAYRATLGLPALPLSAALTTTAGRHVVDVRENIWAADLTLPRGANLHSWSDAPYYEDGRNPEAMWTAPARLGTGYGSAGYEIAAAGQANAAEALAGWRGSPPHRAILDNSGVWADVSFAAIGVGVETAAGAGPYGGRVYFVWFGEAADARGTPLILGTAGSDRVTGTAFADVVVGLSGADHIAGGRGNDRLNGGNGPDTLAGGLGLDRLVGGAGNDLVVGGPGGDRLYGGAGDDLLIAGTGRDWLSGGGGADLFRYRSASEAGLGSRRDTIADFTPGRDHIDLRAIDARADLPGDQAFHFRGALPLGGVPGAVGYAGGVVSGDLDGDGVADFAIGLIGAPALGVDDFLL